LAVLLCLSVHLNAQNIVNVADSFTTEGDTKALGTDIAFEPGDTLNISGSFISGTLTNVSGAALGAVYASGAQSFSLAGTGFNSAGALYLGMFAMDASSTLAPFTGLIDFTELRANTFSGVYIYSGALRVSSVAQLGVGQALSNVHFLGSATLVVASGGNVIFDDNYGCTSQIVIGGTVQGTVVPYMLTIIAEPGATFGIDRSIAAGVWTNTGAGNPTTWTGSAGGAIVVGPRSRLVLSGTLDGDGGGFLFDGNGALARGGAIFASGTASVIIDSATFNNNWSGTVGTNNGGAIGLDYSSTVVVRDSVFSNNVANSSSGAANGGAISTQNTSVINVSNVLFTSNTAMRGGMGGALFGNTGGRIVVNSSTFIGNVAASGSGGAIAAQYQTTGPVLDVENSWFQGNSANIAGAIWLANSITGTIVNTTFTGNVATTGGGGAIGGGYAASGIVNLTLTDVSFYDNHSQTIGGALFLGGNSSILNYNVSAGTTVQIAGNTYGPDNTPSGLYFSNNSSKPMTFTVGQGAVLDMIDPIYWRSANSSTDAVSMNGPGTWNIGGSGTIYPNAATPNGVLNFDINAGTVHFYRYNETSYKGTPVATGGLVAVDNGGGTVQVNFTLHPGATLSAGGGNSIIVSNIFLNDNSTIALDLLGTTANSGSSILTLNSLAGYLISNWNLTISLLNTGSITPVNGDTFNLITLAGGPLFTDANLASMNLVTGLSADYYDLKLSADDTTLYAYYSTTPKPSYAITWNGSAGDNSWSGQNWSLTDSVATGTTYKRGAIVNLADTPGVHNTGTDSIAHLTVDVTGGAVFADMYVSGTTNYSIDGAISMTTDGSSGNINNNPGTGRLVLGAKGHTSGATDTIAYTGNLTLNNGANNFLGGIVVNSGGLTGNALTLGSGTSGITINTTGTVNFNQATGNNGAYAAPITGSGRLVKNGFGDLTLTGNSAAFAGTTDINTGRLLLAGNAALGGNTTVYGNGILAGAGTAVGNINVLSGGAIQLGTGSTGGQTLSITGNLTLNDGSILDYTNNVANTLFVGGSITQIGVSEINLYTITTGSFSVINAPAAMAAFDTSQLDIYYHGAFLTAGSDYTLTKQNNLLWLTFSEIPVGLNNVLTWNAAAADGLWLNSTNWAVADRADKTKSFVQGDAINLDGDGRDDPDTTAPIAIALDATAILTGLYLSGTESYSITGAGSLVLDPNAGVLPAYSPAVTTGKLILGAKAPDDATLITAKDDSDYAFTGTLDLANGSNNFAQGIDIYGGALRFSNTAQLGAPINKIRLLGDATLIVAAGGDATFDGRYTSASQLIIGNTDDDATPAALAIAAEPGALFSINDNTSGTWLSNNAATWTGSHGGAITIGPASTLTLTAPADPDTAEHGSFLFSSNLSYGKAGALEVSQQATATIDNATFANNSTAPVGGGNGGAIAVEQGAILILRDSVLTDNVAGSTSNGGAIAAMGGALGGATIDLANVLFASNTAGGLGGALFANTAGTQIIANGATFANNTALTTGGGAIALQQTGSFAPAIDLNNVTFTGNTAPAGGALWMNTGASGTIANATFTANHSTANGGAISYASTATLTLTNVSFYDNIADAGGGAIWLIGNDSVLNINTTEGNIARIAGNTAGGSPSGIHLNNSYSLLLNIDTEQNSLLDTFDPTDLYLAQQNNPDIITKTGEGTWNFGGTGTIRPANAAVLCTATFNIDEGTLHLYRAGETFHGATPVEAGAILNSDTGAYVDNPRVNTVFNLNDGATLSAGGGNLISVTTLNLAPRSTIALDLTDALAATTGYSVLTLAVSATYATTFNPNNWSLNINLLNIGSLMPNAGDTFNLLTLGAGAGSFPALGTLNITGNIPDGYHLQLSDDGKTLQLYCDYFIFTNSVITWNGAADLTGAAPWTAASWTHLITTTDTDSGINTTSRAEAFYRTGDIVNITDTGTTPDDTGAAPAPASNTINVNVAEGVSVAGIYVSGTDNRVIEGGAITSTPDASAQFAGVAAATGKLILGAISADDASALTTLDYTGTLTLANAANNFAGGIEINTGASLVGNDQTLGAGGLAGPGITIATGASLTFDQTGDATYAGRLAGEGAFAKTGAGTLTLAAANDTFTGATYVHAGTLLLGAGATLGGAANTAPGATFGGAGAIAGNVTIATGANLQVGLDQTTQQDLRIGGDLTLDTNFRLNYLNPANTLAITGTLNLLGTGTLNVAFYQSGSYNLGNIGALKDDLALTINDIPQYPDARQRAELFASDTDALGQPAGDLLLQVVGDCSRILHWTGSANSIWQLTGAEWTEQTGTTAVFGNGDRVILDDADPGAVPDITIARGSVIVSDMYFDGAASYNIAGDTIIASADSLIPADPADPKQTIGDVLHDGDATGKLIKNGSGVLTFSNTANTFTGGIDHNAGALVFAGKNLTATPSIDVATSATLAFAGGTLDAASATLAPGAILTGSGLFRFGDLAYAGNVSADVAAGDILTLTGNYAAAPGGSIVKTGAGILSFTGTIGGNAGITQVNEGTVRLTGISGVTNGASFAIPGNTTITATNGATYNIALYSFDVDNSTFVVPGGVYDVNGLAVTVPDTTIKVASTVTGTTIQIDPETGEQLVVNTSIMTFASTTCSGSATLPSTGATATVNGATIEVPAGAYAVPGITIILPGGTATIATGGTQVLVATTGTFSISGYNHAADINQNYLLNGGTLALTGTGVLNEATASDWAGINIIPGDNAAASAISGVNDIVHIGSGTMAIRLMGGLIVAVDAPDATAVFSNTTSNFTGYYRVDSGTLQLTNPKTLGTVTTGMPKIALNGGALQVSASGVYAGDLQVSSAYGAVFVDDGIIATWTNVTRNTTTTPDGATLVKTGPGTLVVGSNVASGLTVAEGVYRTTAPNNMKAVLTATVAAGATFEISATSTGLNTALGNVGGKSFAITSQGTLETAVAGSGTLLISNGRINFASPSTTIENIVIRGLNSAAAFGNNQAVSSYSPDGTFTVDQGMLVLATISQRLGNVILMNNGALGFVAGGNNHFAFKDATVKSLTYEGPGAGNLYFNCNLAVGRADQLTVLAPIVGNFNIGLYNYGQMPAQYFGSMELIHAPESHGANFNIITPEIDVGLYKYTVTDTTARGVTSVLVTGTGAMSNAASGINVVAGALPITWFTELESVSQRIGELRMEPRETAGGNSVWMRGFGDRYDFNQRMNGTPFGERHYGAEAGYDFKANQAINDRNLYGGAFLGYGRSDRAIAPNESISDSYFGGVYQTFFSTQTGLYFDTVVKFNSFKNKFTINAPTGESTTASYQNWAIGGSLEFGWNRELPYGFFVEPQAQLAGAMFRGATYQTDSGMMVELPAGSSANGRIGIRLGRIFDAKSSTVSIYAKIYGGGEWTTRNHLYVTLPADPENRVGFDPYIQDLYAAAGGGFSWQFKKTNQIYADFDTSQSKYYIKPWSFTFGIRRMW